MIHCIASDKPKQWDLALPQAEFSFNCLPNRSTDLDPFQIVYTEVPNLTVDFVALLKLKSKSTSELADEIVQMHQDVKHRLIQSAAAYKESADKHHHLKTFSKGELVMVHLRKERFPAGTYNKLMPKKIGLCRILHKVNDNAYMVELPSDIRISNTFNVVDLFTYHLLDDAPIAATNSKSSFSHSRED
ncbi:uncharacterized protein LOC133795367 [Humulus lupulus]|uniref:uncharacterized protein LOC133795367 n=1 Tax=Humulus lupulus TaxID=3486 RepID=UPI002B40D7EA|nr:uncharacterized protein LOC133795367 [Humulus lupulus]